MKVPAGMKSCVMPSVGEIFTVSGVDVGTGVEVDPGVAVNGIWVEAAVSDGADVVTVAGGVAVL